MKSIIEEYGTLVVAAIIFIIIATVFPKLNTVINQIGSFFLAGIGG